MATSTVPILTHWSSFRSSTLNDMFTIPLARLTNWGGVTHISLGNLTIIGLDNGLLPGQRQAIIWTNDGILLIGPSRTNFSEISIEIHTFSFNKMLLKMSAAKWPPFCLGLNELMSTVGSTMVTNNGSNIHTYGLVQDCGISIALAMEIPQSCAKPWIYTWGNVLVESTMMI